MNAALLYIFLTACAVLLVVPVIFVMNSVYEDGLIGRCFLLGISFGAATFLLEVAGGTDYELMPQTVFLVVMFAGFLCWHLGRFHSRVLKQKRQLANVDLRVTRERRSQWISSR